MQELRGLLTHLFKPWTAVWRRVPSWAKVVSTNTKVCSRDGPFIYLCHIYVQKVPSQGINLTCYIRFVLTSKFSITRCVLAKAYKTLCRGGEEEVDEAALKHQEVDSFALIIPSCRCFALALCAGIRQRGWNGR